MMKSKIEQMNYNKAKEVAKWIYEGELSFYNMDGSYEDIEEFLNGEYFCATDSEDNLIGYYCFGDSAIVPKGKPLGAYRELDIVDIGLGMNPKLCRQGLGKSFLINGLEFARNQLAAKKFRLTVASFNKPAIKVYERAGFIKVKSFVVESKGKEVEFWVMILQ